MADRPLRGVVRHVRQLADEAVALPDAELMRRFAAARDESAFACLVSRHGALVWSVCRAVLGHEQDAEDAFQATFLVLARRPQAVRKESALASWLYGVARRVALKAQTAAARRRARERRHEPAPPEGPPAAAALRELQLILHEEVERLPAKYRAPFVLCCLEGHSREEAARELAWKEGTLSARLTQARRLLEDRLTRRGVALTAALAASALGTGVASGQVPAALIGSTVQAAAAGAASPHADALAEGVINGMFLTKLKLLTALALATLAVGVGLGVHASARVAPPPQATSAPAAPAKAEGPDLVRAFRRGQSWLLVAKSFHARFEGTITDTKGKSVPEVIEVGFDARRMRHTLARKGFDEELHLWDGKRAATHVRSAGGGADRHIYSRDLQNVGDGMGAGLMWLWGQPHAFWWTRQEKDPIRAQLLRDLEGRPEEFAITGKAVYRGAPCHVLQKKGWHMVRLYVGERTGHLHGRMEDWLLGNPEADRQASKVAAAEGKKVKGFIEFVKWVDTMDNEKGQPLMERVCEKCYPTDHPKNEAWFLDYKEVQPGRWFPMTQGTASYKGTHGKPITQHRSELKATSVKVDEPLPAALFAAPAPREADDVYDATTDPPLSYKHKKDRTAAEWEKLRAEARKLQAEERKEKARRDELVGKAALPFPKGGWLDGKARSWQDLKGKPVLLLFWAEWCAPCHGFLSLLRMGDDALVTVIGVHPPGSARADIEKALKEAKAAAPICIDAVDGKGPNAAVSLFTGYRLPGLPSAVLVDADGKVAALGDPGEVMRRAGELATKAAEKKRK